MSDDRGAAYVIHADEDSDESDDETTTQEVELTGIPWLLHALRDPSVVKRRRTILVALALLIAGTVSLKRIVGLATHQHRSYVSLFVVGLICLVPGAYYVYVIVRALRKVPGFTLEAVPDYD